MAAVQAPFLAGQPLVPLPIADTALAFANMLSIRFEGLTVALEHPYNAYPHDLTFWAEALVALTNTLADPHLRASHRPACPCCQLLVHARVTAR